MESIMLQSDHKNVNANKDRQILTCFKAFAKFIFYAALTLIVNYENNPNDFQYSRILRTLWNIMTLQV